MDLGDLARSAAVRTERRTRLPIVVHDDDGGAVITRPRQIERAPSNLVDNLIKYSDNGTAVEIAVEGSTVVVRDRGPGNAATDIYRVVDRFYRAVDDRSEPGSGLGLSIVEMVRSHGGSVVAYNREGGGTEVRFTFRRGSRDARQDEIDARPWPCRLAGLPVPG